MIWLASFPRSGNTFFRIVLHEVYGIESAVFREDTDEKSNYTTYPVVKTHLLPDQLIPDDPYVPAVYIVRDGRDAMVPIAHHRKDLVAPGSDYYENLKSAIIAAEGSFFGGWSENVLKWIDRASIVMKFEDLIENPIGSVERLRPILELPEPNAVKLPTFDDLKSKHFLYGSGTMRTLKERRRKKRKYHFRRGVVGSWKDEMPADLHRLFWRLHGDAMERLRYTEGRVRQPFRGIRKILGNKVKT